MTQEEQEEDRDLTDVELSDKDAVKVIFFLIFFSLIYLNYAWQNAFIELA